MESETKIGKNRTGLDMSPLDSGEMLQGSARTVPTSEGDEGTAAAIRADYIRESDRIGSVPPPGTIKGVLQTGLQAITGNRPQVLLDKLGERLAFERSGTRLYEALITKCLASGDQNGIIDMDTLAQIHDEEAQHFELVRQAIEQMGADPTAQTPCADLTGVESLGLIQALNDPRTTVTQGLHTILIAELVDNAGWELLIDLAQGAGQTQLAEQFAGALAEEQQHLETVRSWVQQASLAEAKLLS
jgi:bacterioferritin (cytochrome b1)